MNKRHDPLKLGKRVQFVFIPSWSDTAPLTECIETIGTDRHDQLKQTASDNDWNDQRLEQEIRVAADEARCLNENIRDLVTELNGMPGIHAKIENDNGRILSAADADKVRVKMDNPEAFRESEHADRFADIMLELIGINNPIFRNLPE